MTRKTQEVACILPDSTEIFLTVEDNWGCGFNYINAADKAVRQTGLKTNRKNPERVKVKIYSLTIKNGQIERTCVGQPEVTPELERMTDQEFNEELDEILNTLPKAFRSFVSSRAWDEGHSAGHEEVINIARGLAYDLEPAIKEYQKERAKP